MSNIIIINNEQREMTTDEVNSHNELMQLIENNNNQLKTKEDKKSADAKTGNQKLLDLGLSQDEATALTGYKPPVEENA
tara:strand:- start:35 stop:271 length:237 start_codon:yes stop_codon:yes gene_type:complete